MAERAPMRLTAPSDAEWRTIEHEARQQALEAEGQPLALGQSVAWAERRAGRTDGLSLVHRAAESVMMMGDNQSTLCGDKIPPAILRVALFPGLVRTLGRCRYCDAEYLKHPANGAAA